MTTLIIILIVSVICVVFGLILIALSIGIGYLIALMIPSLTITHTITAGAVLTTFIFYSFVKLFSLINNASEEMENDASSDSEQDDESSDIPDVKSRAPIYIIPSSFVPKSKRSSTRKKRKPRGDSKE
ncbi:hypothetical protein [Desulfonatronum parangueonense]